MSGSAALGVGADLIRTYGPDSAVGRTAAVMLGSTETTFYTIAVYFSAAGIKKTRYAVPAALCADLAGFLSAAWAVRLFFPAGQKAGGPGWVRPLSLSGDPVPVSGWVGSLSIACGGAHTRSYLLFSYLPFSCRTRRFRTSRRRRA